MDRAEPELLYRRRNFVDGGLRVGHRRKGKMLVKQLTWGHIGRLSLYGVAPVLRVSKV
jgi:hypothetical protein